MYNDGDGIDTQGGYNYTVIVPFTWIIYLQIHIHIYAYINFYYTTAKPPVNSPVFYCAALVWISCLPTRAPHFNGLAVQSTPAVGLAREAPHLPPVYWRAGQWGFIWWLTHSQGLPRCPGPWHLAGTWWVPALVWVGGCPVPSCTSGWHGGLEWTPSWVLPNQELSSGSTVKGETLPWHRAKRDLG